MKDRKEESDSQFNVFNRAATTIGQSNSIVQCERVKVRSNRSTSNPGLEFGSRRALLTERDAFMKLTHGTT